MGSKRLALREGLSPPEAASDSSCIEQGRVLHMSLKTPRILKRFNYRERMMTQRGATSAESPDINNPGQPVEPELARTSVGIELILPFGGSSF